MSTVDAKIIEHIANSSNSSSTSKDDVFNAIKIMYEITNSPPKEDDMTWYYDNSFYYASNKIDNFWFVALDASSDSNITGNILIIQNNTTNEIEKYVIIWKDTTTMDFSNITQTTPHNGLLVSLTNDKIFPAWIGSCNDRSIKFAVIIATNMDAYRWKMDDELGIFEVSQMSTNTLMKIIENYNKPYNQFALLPE
jgi:hypothetical protein